ncbi:MAG: hypothetical protein OXL37_00995 [Chloroflexota bacterium]|nr:hypothetical protein [Chloroflexota bacterium]MDE2961177.1 hypothetical protein [Chloroflexota bacterium]
MLNWLSRLRQKPTASSGGQLDASEYSVHPPNLRFLTDVSPGRWVEESFPFAFASVCALVPGGYEGYARVLHPAWGASDRMVPWSAVAAWSGRVYHPQMSFVGISSPVPGHGADPSPWDHDPNHGSLDEEVAAQLLPLLAQFTDTPEQCYFGIWEGYGQYSGGATMLTSDGSGRPLPMPRDIRRAQRIRGSDRNYLLYTGELHDITAFYANFLSEPPNIWWPADRTWFVATDIDLDSTYVGGSHECIDALLSHPALEAVPAEYLASVAMTADTINLSDPM